MCGGANLPCGLACSQSSYTHLMHASRFVHQAEPACQRCRHGPQYCDLNGDSWHVQDLAYTCFPTYGGSAAQTLHGFFMSNFCEALTCNWRVRDALLRPLARDRDGAKVLWALVTWGSLAAVALVYGLLFCYWNSRITRSSVLQTLGFKRKTDKLY